MAAIITEKFRQSNADAFSADVASSKYYMFVGKSQPWTSEGATTDNQPPAPVDSVAPESYYWDDMLAAKLISSKSFVVPRRDFATTTAFDMYRHDIGGVSTGNYGTTKTTSSSGATTVFDSTFYFKTSEHKVYKVLYNGDQLQTGAGNISGSEPTSTNAAPFWQDNNYYIKFMYTMTTSEVQNFLTTDFMPVKVNANADANRGVYVFMVTSGGSSYPNGTYYTKLRGDGSGGTCSVTISAGSETAVTITGTPTGYSFAYVRVADINAAGGGALTGAELDVIIEPKGGHGFDPLEELGAFFVILNTSFEGAETANSGDFTTANDFRRVALIRDPKASGSAATTSTLRATKAIRLNSGAGTFSSDEKITQTNTGAVGKVVQYDSANRILFYTQTRYDDEGVDANGNQTAFSGTNLITGATSSATGTPTGVTETVNNVSLVSGYSSSEMDADSGDVMYIENRAPVTRSVDQTENVKLIIEF